MEKEKRSIEIEKENESTYLIQFGCGFTSMAQKVYFNAMVEPELRAVLDKHKKNLHELAYA